MLLGVATEICYHYNYYYSIELLKRYRALAKATDETGTKDLPKLKLLHSCHYANRITAITQLC